MTVEELLGELDDLAVTASRALVVEVHCRPHRRAEVVARLCDHLGERAMVVTVDRSAAARRRLGELNAGRDLVLSTSSAVVLVVCDGEETRWGRAEAPDLTAAFDLVAEVDDPSAGTWAEQVATMRATLADRHRAIDLTGLVPASGDIVELSLDETYLAAAGIDADALPVDRPTLVFGPAGAGKTTSLRWLCRRHSVGSPVLLPERAVVLLASLAAWWADQRDAPLELRKFVEREAGSLCGADSLDLGPHLGDVVLLLDGLDEVTSQDARRAVIDQAGALQRGGAAVVVTGREHVAGEVGEDWNVVGMKVPGEAEAAALVRAVLAARGRTQDVDAITSHSMRWLRSQGEFSAQSPGAAGLAGTPLILVFLAVLADLGGALPTVRVELYRDLVEMLVTSWRRVRSGNGAPPLRRADVFRVLAPLGWEMVRRGVGGLTEGELVEVLLPLERRRHGSDEAARGAARARVAQLRDDTALLRTGSVWSFVHPTVAEYFAALRALEDDACLGALEADPYSPQWSGVVSFAVAYATEVAPRDDVAERLSAALLAGSRRPGRKDEKVPLLLVAVLLAAPGLPDDARDHLADEALRIGLTLKLSARARGRVAPALFSLGLHEGTRFARVVPGSGRGFAAFLRWLCPPRHHVRLGVWAQEGSLAILLLPMMWWAPVQRRHELLVALLGHDDPSVRRVGWGREAAVPMKRLDPELAELPLRLGMPSSVGLYEAALEVYGEEAVREAGLRPSPENTEARRAS